ncbi:MAG TPA: response regulator [Stellaceae bacterium]|nr:response regulator [Stellaceae bacterium]
MTIPDASAGGVLVVVLRFSIGRRMERFATMEMVLCKARISAWINSLAPPQRGGALTGRGDESIRARAYELGVKAYLDKPVANDTLLATIERVVARSKPR